MKKILLLFLTLISCNDEREAKEQYINICKNENDYLSLDYLSSNDVITSIKTLIINDTFELKILVKSYQTHKSQTIKIPQNIKHIKIGEMIRLVNDIDTCTIIKSGKAAIDELKRHTNN